MRKGVISGILFIAILLFGTSGYMLIEKGSFLDSLYMTLITITTVGYGETIHLGAGGKYFTMCLIIVGVAFVLYMFGEITDAMVEGRLRKMFGRRTMDKKLASMKNHYILCGYGRIGKVICQTLKNDNRLVVVIEKNPDKVISIYEHGILVLQGEATDDEILLKAGIKNAAGLIAVVSSDSDNVFISLSARGLNPDLFIMARSSGAEGADTKLLRAGANKVISPYYIGGRRMANMIIRPSVIDFLDLTVHTGHLDLRIEEVAVSEKASYCNRSLLDSNIRKDFDLIVVAIKRSDGEMFFNPNFQTTILAGDTLIVLGKLNRINAFVEIS